MEKGSARTIAGGEDSGRVRAAIERVPELFKWGHITQQEYLKQREDLERALDRTGPHEPVAEQLDWVSRFLDGVVLAWRDATDEGRNKIAQALFEAV